MSAEDHEILLGKLAIQHAYITEAQLEEALRDQGFYSPGTPVGNILLDKGFIDEVQLERLLASQTQNLGRRDRYLKDLPRKDALFGRIALRLGLIDEAQVNWCLREQGKKPEQGGGRRLGAYLVECGFLTHGDVQRILEEQARGLCECPDCDRRYNIIGFDPSREYRCKECKTVLFPVGPDESDADDDLEDVETLDT